MMKTSHLKRNFKEETHEAGDSVSKDFTKGRKTKIRKLCEEAELLNSYMCFAIM